MEEAQRNKIKKYLNQLVSHTDYDTLIEACVNDRLLTKEMQFYIEKKFEILDNKNNSEMKLKRHKELFFQLTRRGPTAYERILEILKRLDCLTAIDILREYTNTTSIRDNYNPPPIPSNNNNYESRLPIDNENQNDELEEYTDEIDERYKFHVEKSTQLHESIHPPNYPMKSNKRGILLLVNIIDIEGNPNYKREGSEIDKFKLIHLYREMKFKIYAYDNLTKNRFKKILEKVIKSDAARDAECFKLILMAHGENDNNKQTCLFNDGAVMDEEEILDYLKDGNCPNLYKKPKICIFPFCRGNVFQRYTEAHKRAQTQANTQAYKIAQTQALTQADSIGIQHDSAIKTIEPSFSDIIICYSTLTGFLANRDRDSGAWYIQAYCQVMAERAHDTDFDSILKLANEKTYQRRGDEKIMQTPNYYNIGFNKNLYFNPGFPQTDNH